MISTFSEITSTSPQIAPLPSLDDARLLDSGMLHYEASLAGSAERYGRGETSHTIHVWWARRPHSAMRALVFASLCKDKSSVASLLLKEVGSASVASPKVILEARRFIQAQYQCAPRLLDMFGGGGTIPMESCNLGADTYSIDANQLSIFIQLCNLVYSQGLSDRDISLVVKASGTRVLTHLAELTAPLFPLRENTIMEHESNGPCSYFWTYSMSCPSCGYQFYLSKRPWLSRKKGQKKALILHEGSEKQSITLEDVAEDYELDSAWYKKNGIVECPRCKTKHSNIDIKKCKDEVIVLVNLGNKGGKQFQLATGKELPTLGKIERIERQVLRELKLHIPESKLPRWSGIVNPALYGVQTHSDFLNRRQRAVMLLLIKALLEEHNHLTLERGEQTARFVICLLSGLIDQIVDWNCRFSMWIPQNEQVGRAFCGPGISMLWDYVETDPVSNGPSNLWGKLNRIVSGTKSIMEYPRSPKVQLGYAQNLPFPSNFFDAIVTDPPYYDNVYYNVLADFFYAWKRLLLQSIEPDLFLQQETESKHELVASKFRNGTSEKAHIEYCTQLSLALAEAERVLKPDGIFSFLYSHSSLKGWEAVVKAYRATRLVITSVQPLSIERRQRPRAMTSEAINTCIAFVAHKGIEKRKISIDEAKSSLRRILDDFGPKLKAVGWNESDIGLAVFANGVGILGNASEVQGCNDDIDALRMLDLVVRERFPTFCLNDRDSL